MIDLDHIRRIVEPLLACPWENGAKGPVAFDCWGLTQHVQRALFERELVDAPCGPPVGVKDLVGYIREHPARRQWKVVEAPVHGCVVEMAHVAHPHHVGTYLDVDGGGVLHCQRATGVTFDSLLGLRTAGWRRLRFNDWVG